MIYLRLFYEFFKTGLFSIGGGMATVPMLMAMSEKTGWFTKAELADMIAISESTPGPIGVNMATYAGNITAGVFGAISATVGLIAPSVIIVLIIAKILLRYKKSQWLNKVFEGLRPTSAALIAAACISIAKIVFIENNDFNIKAIMLAAVLVILTNIPKLKKIHPIVYIVLSAMVGIMFQMGGTIQ